MLEKMLKGVLLAAGPLVEHRSGCCPGVLVGADRGLVAEQAVAEQAARALRGGVGADRQQCTLHQLPLRPHQYGTGRGTGPRGSPRILSFYGVGRVGAEGYGGPAWKEVRTLHGRPGASLRPDPTPR